MRNLYMRLTFHAGMIAETIIKIPSEPFTLYAQKIEVGSRQDDGTDLPLIIFPFQLTDDMMYIRREPDNIDDYA